MPRKGTLTKTITLPNGKRKYIYAKTKKELEQKVLQARIELNAGVDLSSNITFGEFAAIWWATKEKEVSERTALQIKGRVNKHIMPYLARMEIKKIKPIHLNRIFIDMTNAGSTESSQRHIKNYLNQIFSMAVDNGLISKSPMTSSVKTAGRPSKKKESLSLAQQQNILENLPDRFVLTYRILLGTGMRIGELLSLRWEDVDMEQNVISVHSNAVYVNNTFVYKITPKTDAGVRMIPFDSDVRSALLQLKLRGAKEWVIEINGDPAPLTYHIQFNNYLRKIEPGVSAHTLRHTYATKIVQILPIKQAQYVLGHSTAQMTLDVYASVVLEDEFDSIKNAIQRTTNVQQSVVQTGTF